MPLNEALILSYVKRGIGYGYKILNHVKKSRSDEWVDFSRAGLYKTLDKLETAGYVSKTNERSGGRPPKKVYRITEEGERALAEFLENGFNFDYQSKNDLDAYLVAAVAASPDAGYLADKVRRRSEAVRRHIAELVDDWPQDKDAYPLIVF
ncbi:MAG: helix-turn-helix transcriptional regulator, partial [Candidatus Latescibacteria bacterium]|nr:helix-turn-helix transcriptional regulator [Candidatus Latescibacterota bacterium]